MAGSQINVSDCIINSGYCSGNKRALECISKPHSGGCKGTVRSFCVQSGSGSATSPGNVNSGAFSGENGTKSEGSARKCNEGTAANEPPKGYNASEVIGTYRSFNIGIPKSEVSFKAIDKKKATIRDKCCAGRAKSESVEIKKALEGKAFKSCKCEDTEYSFNAENGEKINAKGATLNTGAFAGIGGS